MTFAFTFRGRQGQHQAPGKCLDNKPGSRNCLLKATRSPAGFHEGPEAGFESLGRGAQDGEGRAQADPLRTLGGEGTCGHTQWAPGGKEDNDMVGSAGSLGVRISGTSRVLASTGVRHRPLKDGTMKKGQGLRNCAQFRVAISLVNYGILMLHAVSASGMRSYYLWRFLNGYSKDVIYVLGEAGLFVGGTNALHGGERKPKAGAG